MMGQSGILSWPSQMEGSDRMLYKFRNPELGLIGLEVKWLNVKINIIFQLKIHIRE